MSLKDLVEALVADIPPGCVMTYGDIASCVGHPGAGRVVGGIAHHGAPDLPWHRVVNHNGGLASGYGPDSQADALAQDGVQCKDGRVIGFADRRWVPDLEVVSVEICMTSVTHSHTLC